MTTMVNRVVHTFLKFQGTSTTNPFLLHSTNHFSVFQLGLRLMFLAPFHSTNPRSIFEKDRNLNDALILFDKMTQKRPLPSVVRVLNAVTKMKQYSWSVHLFKQMCALGVSVDQYTMSIVIKCCCQLYRTNDGFALLGCCFKRGIKHNVYTFSTLLNGLPLEERILEAERLFKKLIKQNLCEPDVVMYSTMIKGLCKIGNNPPTPFKMGTGFCCCCCCCKIGNNVTAIALLRLMEDRRCKPNVVTYNTIIDDAFNLFTEMVSRKGIRPDVIIYSSLICGLCKISC